VLTSALHNIGSATLLDLLAEMFPDPPSAARPSATRETGSKGNEVQRKIGDAEPVSIFVFKTLADPFSGRISYFKVMSGVLKNDATLQNFTRGTSERLQHVQVMQGKTAAAVPNCTPAIWAPSRNSRTRSPATRSATKRRRFTIPCRTSRAFDHLRGRAQDARR
jgi:translation elongation factor EF-G